MTTSLRWRPDRSDRKDSPASVSLGESFLSDRSGRHLRLVVIVAPPRTQDVPFLQGHAEGRGGRCGGRRLSPSCHLAASLAVPPLAVLLLLRPCRPGRCPPRTPYPPYDTCAPCPGAVDEPLRRPPEPQPTPVLAKEEPQPTPVTVPEELVLGWDALRASLCESPHGVEARNGSCDSLKILETSKR